jgi:pimeloyl-ACP methyl ester carboxylesterase
VIGVSMGAAYAHACAAAHPKRVTSVVILSGMGPVNGHERLRAGNKADSAFWLLARRAPWLLQPLCGLTASMTLASARAEAAVLGLAGRVVPPLGKGQGVLLVEDRGQYRVEPLDVHGGK